MKICMATMLNEKFLCAFEAFWKSFIFNNKWFDLDFVILDNGLEDETKKKILKYYDKCIFEEINYKTYKNVNFKRTHQRLKCTFYKLDVFALDYDRVVYIDMDTIVLADISALFEAQDPFVGVKAYRERQDILEENINSGVFVVNKKFLNRKTYNEIVKFSEPGFSMPDQTAINNFFKGRISFANKSYNCEKRIIHSKKFKHFNDVKNIKILHFVGSKPWEHKEEKKNKKETQYREIEELWWQWYGEDQND